MDPCQGSSSRRSTTAAGRDNKHKEVVREQSTVGAMAEAPSYRLFPEEAGRNSGSIQIHEVFSADRQQAKPLEVDSMAIATPQHCLNIQAWRQLSTFFPGGIHSSSSQGMYSQENNVNQTTEDHVPMAASASIFGVGKNLGATGNVEEDHEEATPLSHDAMMIYEHLIGVHAAYFRACNVHNMSTSRRLSQQVVQEQNTHHLHDTQVSHYGDSLVEAHTTVVPQQRVPSIVGSSEVQHYEAIGLNNTIPSTHQEQMVAPLRNPSLRLMHIRGQVAASCGEANGSRFVQQAIEVATLQEIIMVYDEIMPCVRNLAVDVFGNHAIQKILEYGPRSCKRELISRLIGHVLPLSCHAYGCRVIQKALDVGEQNQKTAIVKELKNNVIKCVCDQFGSHVIQKCIECLPPKHIHFIFRSFCGKAKALSIHPSGSRVLQKVITHCDIPGVYHKLAAEIIEFANKLSANAFGNYVVQHLLEHGSQAERSMIVRKFDRCMVSMCYHKFASKVLEKSLVFGSQEDRQLIINEILGNAGSQHVDYIADIMIHGHGNFIIQKMVVMAEEHQAALLLDVARKNADTLKRYPHGRHFIAAMENFLSAKEGRPVLLVPPRPYEMENAW